MCFQSVIEKEKLPNGPTAVSPLAGELPLTLPGASSTGTFVAGAYLLRTRAWFCPLDLQGDTLRERFG
jgi:hypothetical protein